jgi:hypothetical protein
MEWHRVQNDPNYKKRVVDRWRRAFYRVGVNDCWVLENLPEPLVTL